MPRADPNDFKVSRVRKCDRSTYLGAHAPAAKKRRIQRVDYTRFGEKKILRIFSIGRFNFDLKWHIFMAYLTKGGFSLLHDARSIGIPADEEKMEYYACIVREHKRRRNRVDLLVFGGASDAARDEVARLIRECLVRTAGGSGAEVRIRSVSSLQKTNGHP